MTKEEFMQVAQWITEDRCETEFQDGKWYKTACVAMPAEFSLYRRIPEPPKPKLRPWLRLEEVPVGALLRFKNRDAVYLILSCVMNASGYLNLCVSNNLRNAQYPEDLLRNNAEYTFDAHDCWNPCGVLEERV